MPSRLPAYGYQNADKILPQMSEKLSGNYIITHDKYLTITIKGEEKNLYLSPALTPLVELTTVKTTWTVTPTSTDSNSHDYNLHVTVAGILYRLDRHGKSTRDGSHPALNVLNRTSGVWVIEKDEEECVPLPPSSAI